MSLQHLGHLIVGIAALGATLAISSLTVNRLVKRKLKLSVFLLGAYVALHVVLALWKTLRPETDAQLLSFERLAFAAGLINLLVIAFINPLRADRVPDRFPTILQDFIVISLLLLVATFVWHDSLLTTSAVSAVVIGFALQDTLGNAFAGLAIQSEKPFNIGHWVKVGDFEGRVAEVTWRATKLRTKSGNFVILPNNLVGKEAITNYSEPAAPTRIEVEVGASYLTGPNVVKAALAEALRELAERARGPRPRHHARPLRRLVGRLPRAILDRGLRARRSGARPGADGDLLRVRAPRHRHPVADPGAVRQELGRSQCCRPAERARAVAGQRRSVCGARRGTAARDCGGDERQGLRRWRGDRAGGGAGGFDVRRRIGPGGRGAGPGSA